MAMQYDILSAHINQSGQLVTYPTRLKGGSVTPSSTLAGTVNLWDTLTAPVSATYARTGTTITVTSNAHGLQAGQSVGITFSAGGATNGNYVITSVTTNTFNVTDINSGTVAALTACTYGTRWLTSFDTLSGGNLTVVYIPAEGLYARNGIYAQISNESALTIFYG